MIDSCNSTIISFELLFSHIAYEVEYSKGILSCFFMSSTLYAICGGLGDSHGSGVVDGVALEFDGGVDSSGELCQGRGWVV